MRHHDNGTAGLVDKLAKDSQHLLAARRIEIPRRFVCEHDERFIGKRARDGDALTFTSGQLPRKLIQMTAEAQDSKSPVARSRISRSLNRSSALIGSMTLASAVNSGSRKWN